MLFILTAALWRVLPLPSLLSHRKWGTERLINWPKVTQLVNGGSRNRTEATRLWSSCSNLLLSSCDRNAKYRLLTVYHVRCPRMPFETNLATSLWDGLYILLMTKESLQTLLKPYPKLYHHKHWSWDSNPSLYAPKADIFFHSLFYGQRSHYFGPFSKWLVITFYNFLKLILHVGCNSFPLLWRPCVLGGYLFGL